MENIGILYVVATPIGHLDDITLRARIILTQVDRLLAEDTRRARVLLSHHGVQQHVTSLHEHNEKARVAQVLQWLRQGQRVALISDAGTPVIRDPGQCLVAAVHQAELPVVPIPGPCAVTAALSAWGLGAERFIFEGFLPTQATKRRACLAAWLYETRPVVLFEAPHRVTALLQDMHAVLGPQRLIGWARELTKRFEDIQLGTVSALLDRVHHHPPRGEWVLVIQGSTDAPSPDVQTAVRMHRWLTPHVASHKQALALAAHWCGVPRNVLYQAVCCQSADKVQS